MQLICNKPFLSVHLTDIVQLGIVTVRHGLEQQLHQLLHGANSPFIQLAVQPTAGAYMGSAKNAEQVGVFCISLSIDLNESMGVSYRELLTKSWTIRNDFVNRRCIFQLFTLCSRFAHAIFTVLAFGPLS